MWDFHYILIKLKIYRIKIHLKKVRSFKSWYLYQLVTQNMMRMHEVKYVFSEKKRFCDFSRSNQITDQITDIGPYEFTYF